MILKDCRACKIYSLEEAPLLQARVRCLEEEITLHFEGENIFGNEKIQLRIDFFDSRLGCVKTRSEIRVYENENPRVLEPWMAKCQILEVGETIQRQKDLRVRTEKEIRFLSDNGEEFTGTVENISGGGLYLTTKIELNVDDQFSFRYCFLKKEQEVSAVVLRKEELPRRRFGYGCQFVHIPNSTEKEIRQFVFKQQLNRKWS